MSLRFLRQKNKERAQKWPGGAKLSLEFQTIEFGGEAGELLNKIKKHLREVNGTKGSVTSIEAIADEMGDVIICLDLVAQHFDIDLEQAWRTKFNKTSKKYDIPCIVMNEGKGV